jgi:glycosyltransferase involved in cell wall biosynthesis
MADADFPEVTVVIPTRNRYELLAAHALPSALGQRDVRLEVVIIDDASSEDTRARLEAIEDVRVRVLRNATREGIGRGRNKGIAEARGEWLAFLDDDDFWAPHKLRTQLDVAASANASFAYSTVALVDANAKVLEVVPAPEPQGLARRLLARNLIWSPSLVIAKATLVREVGGFDDRLSELADWDLWIRLAAAAPAAACDEILVAYLVHAQNMRAVDEFDVFDELKYCLDKHRVAREQAEVDFDFGTFARWVATGDLRANRRLAAASVFLRSGLAHRNPGNIVRAPAALFGRHALTARHRITSRLAGAEPAWITDHRSRLPR